MSTKVIITYGTYDLFHVGHVRLLKRLKSLGEKLVVGLSSDKFNEVKGKKVVIPYDDKKEILLATKYVDHVFPEDNWEQKREDILREKASIFAMGYDWAGHFDDLTDIIDVVYLPRTQNVSTTELKSVLNNLDQEKLSEVRNGSHESVGGQPTIGFDLDLNSILTGLGFSKVFEVSKVNEIENIFNEFDNLSKSVLIINVKQGSRDDLGRPTTTPQQNKEAFMKFIQEKE
jgi:glycerol-3-phosphate cytidylyltransferase